MIKSHKTLGIPKEIKQHEYRVSMTPKGVKTIKKLGHNVIIETGAGHNSGYSDDEYEKMGAIISTRDTVFDYSDVIMKVKEPQESEYSLIRKDQTVFTFFHFAGCPGLEQAMKERDCICVQYETVQKDDGSLPILMPMSEIAGRLSIQEGMKFLLKNNEGRGILLSGVAGVEPANVVVIGGGTVGFNAAKLAAGLGAKVTILDNNISRLRFIENSLPPNVFTLFSTENSIEEQLMQADLVVGGVLIPGKEAPKLVDKSMIKKMKQGSVFVDVAIDQGGMTEVSRPTSHNKPIFKYEGVSMFCVPNMPGIVPYTSTNALANATLPYIIAIMDYGIEGAAIKYPELKGAILK